MTRISCALIVCLAAVLPSHGQAPAPGLAGTWKLDQEKSRVVPGASLAGLMPAGVPPTLHITQAANGTVVIESQINEGHARFYVPGGRSTTPAGQTGTIAMTTKWDGARLVAVGRQENVSGTTTVVKDVTEIVALTPDGKTLTIEITSKEAEQTSVSALQYTRSHDVGPCQSWPTPCKAVP